MRQGGIACLIGQSTGCGVGNHWSGNKVVDKLLTYTGTTHTVNIGGLKTKKTKNKNYLSGVLVLRIFLVGLSYWSAAR
jgi:hypothetical protein